ncbi:MAG TPA: Type 1 glutamine amidotransferase-like domain-containing protein [Longimicrobiaceae bacterium]
MSVAKPFFLLADAQLLVLRGEGDRLLERVRRAAEGGEPGRPLRAAWLGASADDSPEGFELFAAAMERISPVECRMVRSAPSDDERAFLESADLVLLSGGDTARGWNRLRQSGLDAALRERHVAGAVLMGISAGAIQLGPRGWRGSSPGPGDLFDTLGLLPFVVDAHAEATWRRLRQVLLLVGEGARGIGIPAGGAAVVHPDGAVEAVRHPVTELSVSGGAVRQRLLAPEPAVRHDGRPRSGRV